MPVFSTMPAARRRDAVRPRRAAVAATVAALLGWAAAGCGGGGDDRAAGNAPPADEGPDAATIEALRALPYAGSAPVGPDARDGVVVHDPDRTQPGRRLVTIQTLARAELIDPSGTVVHAWSDPDAAVWERAELLPGGDLLVVGAEPRDWPDDGPDFRIADDARYVERLAPDGTTRWRTAITAHHDVELAPDGRLALLTFERRLVPLVDPRVPVRDDRVTRLDPATGAVGEHVGMLSPALGSRAVFPLIGIAPDELGGAPWIDLFHANSLEWMRDEALFGTHPVYAPGHVLLCFRNQDRVAVLDVERSRFVWAWGEDDLGGPHDAQLLPGGTILVFDNGLGRGASRALEIDPRTDRVTWEWAADPPESFYTPTKGSVQRLPNGNTLLAESDSGRAIEVAPDGAVVWEWLCPHRVSPAGRATIVRMRWVGEDPGR